MGRLVRERRIVAVPARMGQRLLVVCRVQSVSDIVERFFQGQTVRAERLLGPLLCLEATAEHERLVLMGHALRRT
uniref:Orf protein n=1 Tax=Toxoplasma gondii TaxID=5811 RepID=Q26267_TOXGO|nr:orf [Toxoplasma gondii]